MHGLLINHDYLTLLAQQRQTQFRFSPFYLTHIDGPDAPEYLLSCVGCGSVYRGRHYFDPHADFDELVASRRVPYEKVLTVQAPAGCSLVAYHKIRRLAEPRSVSGLRPIPEPVLGYIDSVNAASLSAGTVGIDAKYPLRITGWAVDRLSGKAAAGVYLEIADHIFSAEYGIARPDVAVALRNQEYANSGFSAEIPLQNLPLGDSNVRVLVINTQKTAYYVGPAQQITLK